MEQFAYKGEIAHLALQLVGKFFLEFCIFGVDGCGAVDKLAELLHRPAGRDVYSHLWNVYLWKNRRRWLIDRCI